MGFIANLRALGLQRQILLAATVLGVLAAMAFLVRSTLTPPMSLLYAGLDPVRAGEVITELEQLDVPYEIRGEAIFIPNNVRDKTRFALARDGLPRQSIQGYELLDDVNGFSVTSEMYNAAYWRAKEGELTRTILTTPGVDSARVHIGANLRSGFSRTQPTPTASVTLSSARRLSTGQAEAIQYLVALAVAGLNPEDVAVIDPAHGILAGPNTEVAEAPSVVAEDEAGALEQKIKRLLFARLGDGNAEVSVNVDVSRERTMISDVRFDPESRVIRSRTTNDSNATNQGGPGGLTVASNLPQGAGAGGQGESTSKASTETVNYELNETRTQTERMPGQIERVSIAVLLNQEALGIDLAGPNAAEALEQVRQNFAALVSNAAGLDQDRGDTLTVELMPFQPVPEVEMTPAPGLLQRLIEQHLWSAAQAMFLGLIVLALGFGVMRPIFASGGASGAGAAALGGAAGGQSAGVDGGADADLFGPASDPIDYLKDYTSENQEQTAALLQDWLKEDRKAAANE
ncbi:MAG: flagellar basal-body MS-ring/collar protein FliF [Pseudomonadota bacterium]